MLKQLFGALKFDSKLKGIEVKAEKV